MGVYTKLSLEERNFIEKKYNLKIKNIKNISSGILNSNFYIETENENFILRIYEADRTLKEEEMELNLLSEISDFIPVALAIKNIDGAFISLYNNIKFSLFKHIEGKNLEKIATYNIKEIAIYLGKFHSFSKNITSKDYVRKTRIDLKYYYEKVKKSNFDFEEKERLLKMADEVLEVDFSHLPSGIIHGDIFPDNVIIDESNKIKAILDFNESHYSAFIFDIAIVINFWIRINNFDFFTENNMIRDFLNNYSQHRKIERDELNLLEQACKKVVLTFVFLRIYKEKIENSYDKAYSVEKKSYLSLLNLLERS